MLLETLEVWSHIAVLGEVTDTSAAPGVGVATPGVGVAECTSLPLMLLCPSQSSGCRGDMGIDPLSTAAVSLLIGGGGGGRAGVMTTFSLENKSA